MPRKSSTEVEFDVQDPLADRVLTQEITFLAQPGRRITQNKIDYLERVQQNVTGLMAEAIGLEMLDVKSNRK